MKCNHCTADIPPQWVHSINTNICPSCGGSLMTDDEAHMLTDLREAMSKMPNNPEGIAGWLLSNYKLEKCGDGEPTEFHQPKEPPKKYQTDSNQNENLVNKFLKRTGIKPKDNSHFKNLVKQIKSGENEEVLMDSDESDEEVNISASEGFDDDNDDVSPILKSLGAKNKDLQYEMASSGSVGKISRSS